MNIDLTEAKVYVGTYKKYNEGSLFGKWLLLSDYDSVAEFYEACRELHSDEDDAEFMFQDYEDIPKDLISECSISENLFEILNALSEMDDIRLEPFFIWCNNGHYSLAERDIDDLIASFEEEYIGKYDDEEDYARERVEERSDLNDFALQYFDYESYAKDLFCGDYWSSDGHVFISR